MPTTSNFGWTTPADTDLVKDGALAIRTLGNGIDTSFLDLKGGTTGQILSKASNTDLDYTWINNDQGDITEVQAGTGISVASGTGPIPVVTNTVATAFDAKGDLIGGTGADTFSRLAVGTNGQVLTADSTTSTGLKWAAATSGLTLIKTASFSNVADTGTTFDDVFSSTYTNYVAYVYLYVTTAAPDIQLQMRYAGPTTQTTGYYNSISQISIPGATQTLTGNSNQAQYKLKTGGVGSSGEGTVGIINFLNANDSNYKPYITSQLIAYGPGPVDYAAGYVATARAYTGFLMKYSAQNIYGTISVYGVSK